MTYDHGKAITSQFASIRMSAAEHRDAIAYMRRGEAIADLILWVARLPRRTVRGMTRFFRNNTKELA